MMRDYTNQMRKIELRTKEAEKRATDAMTQVYVLSNNLIISALSQLMYI